MLLLCTHLAVHVYARWYFAVPGENAGVLVPPPPAPVVATVPQPGLDGNSKEVESCRKTKLKLAADMPGQQWLNFAPRAPWILATCPSIPQVRAAHCTFYLCFQNVIDSLQGKCRVALTFGHSRYSLMSEDILLRSLFMTHAYVLHPV